jgi:hypothetical protein
MQTAISRPDRLALQAQWLNHRMEGHPTWRRDMPGPKLFMAGDRTTYVVCQLLESGEPEVLDVLRVIDVEASFTQGLTLVLSSGTDAMRLRVSTYPREILPGVFAWIPPFAEVRHCPARYDDPTSTWRMTVPMFVRSDAGSGIEVGQTSVMTRKEFCERWPHVVL